MICPICKIEIKNPAPHFIHTHNTSVKEYYDEYLKKENEGNCKICGKETKFNGFKGYRKYCSKQCSKLDAAVQRKYENTMKDRYGITTPFQDEAVQNKIKKTNNKKYGGDSPFSSKQVQDKAKQTLLEKYGVDNCFKSHRVREKIKQTCLKKYGTTVGHSFGSKEFKDTMNKKYGVDYASQNEGVKQKIKKTSLQKFGVQCILNLDEVKQSCNKRKHTKEADEKRTQTSLKHYGVEHPLQSNEVRDKIKDTNKKRYGFEFPTQNKKVIQKSINKRKKTKKIDNEIYNPDE